MLQRGRQLRRGHKRMNRKRKIMCFAAWMIVILAVMLTASVFHAAASKVKNMREAAFIKEEKLESKTSSETVSVNSKMVKADAADMEKNTLNEALPRADILLVNKENILSEHYEVTLVTLNNGNQVSEEIYNDLRSMLADGEEQEKGLSFIVASGYRTQEKQERLLQEEIEKNISEGMLNSAAYEDAVLTVAPAGYSEHETGLAVDIVAETNQRLDETQQYTAENQWLRENCYKYGFILRYPKGKEEITGVAYESWHFRYVGKEAAKEITEQNITLEEYLD